VFFVEIKVDEKRERKEKKDKFIGIKEHLSKPSLQTDRQYN